MCEIFLEGIATFKNFRSSPVSSPGLFNDRFWVNPAISNNTFGRQPSSLNGGANLPKPTNACRNTEDERFLHHPSIFNHLNQKKENWDELAMGQNLVPQYTPIIRYN